MQDLTKFVEAVTTKTLEEIILNNVQTAMNTRVR